MATQLSVKSLVMSLCLVPASFALTTVASFAQPSPSPSPVPVIGPYPPTIAQGFVQNCKNGALKQNSRASEPLVLSFCQCVINQLQAQLPVGDFIELDTALNAPTPKLDERQMRSNAVLTQAGQTCGTQVRGTTP